MAPPPVREPREDEALPFAEDEEVVELDDAPPAPVSAEFEQAPDTNLDLFGQTFGQDFAIEPETTVREPVLIIRGSPAAPGEIKVVVGTPAAAPPPLARAVTTPSAAPVATPSPDSANTQPAVPKYRPKLLNRAVVEKRRTPEGKKPG